MTRPPLVFAVGCPRSGTSAFARWLHACGLTTVEDDRHHASYPSGFYEHLPMLMFHRSLERLSRGSDYRITAAPYISSDLLDDAYVAQSFELAFRPALDHEVDFIKYPQLALSIDFLFERFGDVHVIATWRDPMRAFRSLVTREFPSEWMMSSGVRSFLLWGVYAHHLIRAKRARPDAVTLVQIEAFLDDPGAGPRVLERAGRSAGAAVPVEDAVDRARWRQPLGLSWRFYYRLIAWTSALARGTRSREWGSFADHRALERELRSVSDVVREQ